MEKTDRCTNTGIEIAVTDDETDVMRIYNEFAADMKDYEYSPYTKESVHKFFKSKEEKKEPFLS